MRRKRLGQMLVLSAAIAVAIVCATDGGRAATWDTCNGHPVIWRDPVVVHRNRCSIPDTGDRNSAYWNGVRQWDDYSNLVQAFRVNSASDCTVNIGDTQNEIGIVHPDTIDGALGFTMVEEGVCGIGANDIDNADMMIANNTTFVALHGGQPTSDGRVRFAHEFGHFFGFEHEQTHAMMRQFPPLPVGGGSSLEHAHIWPTDAKGMFVHYGFATSRPNLIPSATGVQNGSMVSLNTGSTITMCRGSTRNFRFYLGNSGNVASGTYNIRIRLNRSSPISGGGYTATTTSVAAFTHSLAAFTEGTFDLPVTIPGNLPLATYFIYIDLDHTGSITELREGDNTTFGNTRIRVNC